MVSTLGLARAYLFILSFRCSVPVQACSHLRLAVYRKKFLIMTPEITLKSLWTWWNQKFIWDIFKSRVALCAHEGGWESGSRQEGVDLKSPFVCVCVFASVCVFMCLWTCICSCIAKEVGLHACKLHRSKSQVSQTIPCEHLIRLNFVGFWWMQGTVSKVLPITQCLLFSLTSFSENKLRSCGTSWFWAIVLKQ